MVIPSELYGGGNNNTTTTKLRRSKKSFRLPFLRKSSGGSLLVGALSLSVASHSSVAAAASSSSFASNNNNNTAPPPYRRHSSSGSGVEIVFENCTRRRNSLDSLRSGGNNSVFSGDDNTNSSSSNNSGIGDPCNNSLVTRFGRWAVSSASARKSFSKSAFALTPRKVVKSGRSSNSGATSRIRPSATSAASSSSMKRASQPAFSTASTALKRSFSGKLEGATSLTMSASCSSLTKEDKQPSSNSGANHNTPPPLYNFRKSFNHSWINNLSPEDPLNYERSTSKYSGGSHPGRPVYNGHFVRVRPTPLKNPKLVIYSEEMCKELGIGVGEVESESFLRYFSGDVDGAFQYSMGGSGEKGGMEETPIETWATPYALSIMGRRYTNNCPFGTGDGYGDGRAISVGEVVVPFDTTSDPGPAYPHHAKRYELQLKGAGQTPFCRGADGRAVLRSSIREFLASEAMHHLGVCTTRALSLVVSDGANGDTSNRPWYSDNAKNRTPNLPRMDDPRLAQYSDAEKKEIISQLAAQAKADPDTLVEERCAITTRVASSFVRIGHLDLFARRVEMISMKNAKAKNDSMEVEEVPVKETPQYQELEDMMWHACYREYYNDAYEPYWESKDAKSAAMALMNGTMNTLSRMVANWVRVGFVQGNFNADNCLVGGRTMDYGPFGFLDVYVSICRVVC